MKQQVLPLTEPLATVITVERLHLAVYKPVVLEVLRPFKLFATYITKERLLVVVSSLVDSQVVSPAEHFSTGGAGVARVSAWERNETGRGEELGENRHRAWRDR